MKVGIVGYRFFNDYNLFEKSINDLNLNITTIISGGCQGADKLAEEYAKKYNIPMIIHCPNWSKYGNKAGPIRNTTIINDSDYLIAFLSPKSKGTYDSINKAKNKKIPITILNI